MLTAAKGMCVLVGVIQFFCPSDIQSTCKAKKMPFIFWTLRQNIELGILCSFHSIARVPVRSVVGGYPEAAAW
jgi:hypothetical protein